MNAAHLPLRPHPSRAVRHQVGGATLSDSHMICSACDTTSCAAYHEQTLPVAQYRSSFFSFMSSDENIPSFLWRWATLYVHSRVEPSYTQPLHTQQGCDSRGDARLTSAVPLTLDANRYDIDLSVCSSIQEQLLKQKYTHVSDLQTMPRPKARRMLHVPGVELGAYSGLKTMLSIDDSEVRVCGEAKRARRGQARAGGEVMRGQIHCAPEAPHCAKALPSLRPQSLHRSLISPRVTTCTYSPTMKRKWR